MRSNYAAVFSTSLVATLLLALTSVTTASAEAATPAITPVTTLSGAAFTLASLGGGAFEAGVVGSSNGNGAFITVDAAGNQSAPQTIPTYCGNQVEMRGMAVFPGTNGAESAYETSDRVIWTNINGTRSVLTELTSNVDLAGMAISPASNAGIRYVNLALNDTVSNTAYLEIIAMSSTGGYLGESTVTNPGFTALGAPTLLGSSIYVTNPVTGAVFSVTGSTVRTVISTGTFEHPGNVAQDDQGNLYVPDNGTDTLYRVNTDTSITDLGSYGKATPPVDRPTHSAIPQSQYASALIFDSATRSLLMARIDTVPPGAKRACSAEMTLTTVLRIRTAPSAPSGVTVVANGTAATLSWTASSDEVPGDLYTVTGAPGGATCTAVAPTTSCVVTGLAPMTSYTFTVLAQSADGFGTAIATSVATSALPATGDASRLLGGGGLLLGGLGCGVLLLRRRIVGRR